MGASAQDARLLAYIVGWIVVFAFAAVVTLSIAVLFFGPALKRWIEVGPKLKNLLIANVVAQVLAAGFVVFKGIPFTEAAAAPDTSNRITEAYLLGDQAWVSEWAQGRWQTKARFYKKDDGTLAFDATTTYRSHDEKDGTEVTKWWSTEPIKVPPEGVDVLKFKGVRKVYKRAEDLGTDSFGATEAETVFEYRPGRFLFGEYHGVEETTGSPPKLSFHVEPR
jgi:hypothetical protein